MTQDEAGTRPPPLPKANQALVLQTGGNHLARSWGSAGKLRLVLLIYRKTNHGGFSVPSAPPPQICSILNVIENLLPNFPNALLDLGGGKTSKDGRLMNSGF